MALALVSWLAACDGSSTERAEAGEVQAAGLGSGSKLARDTLLRPNKSKPSLKDQSKSKTKLQPGVRPDSEPAPTDEPKDEPKPDPESITGAEEGPLVGLRAAHDAARAEVSVSGLAWSKTVAVSAQQWANQLAATTCQLAHDPNRGGYGENLYMYSSTKAEPVPAAQVVGSWTAEAANYDAGTHTCTSGICGHYTQVVWADTRYLGCGVAFCEANNMQTQIWVCRYDPHGNVTGKQPF